MSKKEVTLIDLMKKYDNPHALLVQKACYFNSEIHIESGSVKINAKSIMGVMMFHFEAGTNVTIYADGPDETDAIKAMEGFLTDTE